MKIALGQMYVRSGHCDENFERLSTMVNDAKKQGADIIVFPELCISGACLSDKWMDDDFSNYVHSFNDKVKELSDNIGIVFGNLVYGTIDEIPYGMDGRKSRFNAILFAHNKKWIHTEHDEPFYVKHTSINSHLNDDARYFISGTQLSEILYNEKKAVIAPFNFEKEGKTYKLGILHYHDFLKDEIVETLVNKKVDYIVNLGSINYKKDAKDPLHEKVTLYKEKFDKKMPSIVYVNCCGMQNTGKNMIVMDGGSRVYNQEGERIFSLNDAFKEELAIYDKKSSNTFIPCENKVLEALTYSIAEVDKQMFGSRLKWIIGLSGGIDSCINAALLVKAIGNDRVVGYNMASAYNSLTTKNNARILAERLGIEIREGSIELLNEASLKTMEMYNYKDTYGSLVYENIQARIRGHLLSTFASIEGGVIINNANKIEVALGYCTLYGDAIGALAPIGDLTKVECFEVARLLNEHFGKEVISYTLIPEVIGDDIKWDMPPSAELKDAQFDPMKWFYHDEIVKMLTEYPTGKIEDFMQSYLDGSIYSTSMGKWIHYYHLEKGEDFIKDLEWLFRTMSNAVFKRIQMPPIVLLSTGAFGSDYRESQLGFIQTSRYKELKEKIMNM